MEHSVTLQPSHLQIPVDSLPNELLIEIVGWDRATPAIGRTDAWIRLACVCRRWRAVILATPTLWTDVDLTRGASYSRACFKRSEDLPLVVYVFGGKRKPIPIRDLKSVFTEMRPHAVRIQELHLVMPSNKKLQESLSKMVLRMCNLEALTLKLKKVERTEQQWPDPFLTDATHPFLRRLDLNNVLMTPNMVTVTGLWSLSLTLVHDLEMDDLLDILEVCRELRELKLICIGPLLDEGIEELPNGGRHIALPHLREFLLVEGVEDVAYIMSHFDLPPHVCVYISVTEFTASEADGPLTLSSILSPNHLHLASISRTDILSIDCSTGFELNACTLTENRGRCTFSIGIEPHPLLLTESVPSLLHELPTQLSLLTITRLKLRGELLDAVSVEGWRVLLRQCAALKELHFSDVFRNLLKAMAQLVPAEEILCPQLQEISAEGLRTGNRKVMRLLVSLLSQRAAAGHRLSYFCICGVHEAPASVLSEHTVDAIADVVDDFVCEGKLLPESRKNLYSANPEKLRTWHASDFVQPVSFWHLIGDEDS